MVGFDVVSQSAQYTGTDLAQQVGRRLCQMQSRCGLRLPGGAQLVCKNRQRLVHLCADVGAVGASMRRQFVQDFTCGILGSRGRGLYGFNKQGFQTLEVAARPCQVLTGKFLRTAGGFLNG